MVTRRRFLKGSSAALVSQALLSRGVFARPQNKAPQKSGDDPVEFVNPMIGTGGHGHTYPGASVPFGAVQLSPDTGVNDWDHCSGYHFSDSKILGFSHTHLSGTGIADMLDFLVTPSLSTLSTQALHFSHANEQAEPGYYSVRFENGLRAEMTATERVGLHRYTFPKAGLASITIDLTHHAGDDSDGVPSASLDVVGRDGLSGGRTVNAWAEGRQIFFSLKASRAFEHHELFAHDQKLSTSSKHAESSHLKCVMQFKVKAGESILLKVGISGVSTEGAQANLNSEITDWDFDRVRRAARSAWNSELSRVRIETKDIQHKQIFYTALYHAMLAPTLFDDVDRRYRGMDGKIHTLPDGAHNYSTYSLWDTFRALHPLFTLFQAARVPDFVNALIRMSHESPTGVPVWPLQGIETACMTGYHSVSVIAEACVKGFSGIDYPQAYAPMRRRAFEDDYQGLAFYRKHGYVAADETESASKTLEYCYNDWAIAHVAAKAGAAADARTLAQRSLNYKNLFDKHSQFIRARKSDGIFVTPFNPLEIGHKKGQRDYTESNAWQTTFGIMHDPQGLIECFGGKQAFLKKLDQLFNQSSKLPPDMPPDIAGLIGQYAHGNEPSHHIAYLYTYAGEAYKTQALAHRLLTTMYHAKPDGMAGNEDCGQMSAWYIMSAMGFYAVDPVSGNYVFGSPLFDRVDLKLREGVSLVVETVRQSPDEIYVQSITLNGQPYTKMWFNHQDIQNGAHFILTMGRQPNLQFGTGTNDLPPSLG